MVSMMSALNFATVFKSMQLVNTGSSSYDGGSIHQLTWTLALQQHSIFSTIFTR
jgi:hypothetical protein